MLKGIYRDKICLESRVLHDSGWISNHIVTPCDTLAATLFNNESGFKGIICLAIGCGEQNWDHTDKVPSGKETKLTSEVIRFPLKKAAIRYIDDDEKVTTHPTNHLRVTCTINVNNFPGFGTKKVLQLREFGLFGGNATDKKDSGQMIDYVIHPRIDLMSGIDLIRIIDFYFNNIGVSVPVPPEPHPKYPPFISGGNGKLVTLPLRAIDGIGAKYEQELAAAGIITIKQLAEIDPAAYSGTIPLARMNEFRSKATFSTRIIINPEILTPFLQLSVDAFIKTPINEISNEFDENSLELIRQQQLELALLESSFNTKMLRALLIKEILPE